MTNNISLAPEQMKAASRGAFERGISFCVPTHVGGGVPGSIEPPHIVNANRRLLQYTNFYQAEIKAADTESQDAVIRYSGGHVHCDHILYDRLVKSQRIYRLLLQSE